MDIKNFCSILKNDDDNNKIIIAFNSLDQTNKILFIEISKKAILDESKQDINNEVPNAVRLCVKFLKIFRTSLNKWSRSIINFIDGNFSIAYGLVIERISIEDKKNAPKIKREKKIFEKRFQKYPCEPWYQFYKSLYEEDENNKMAITWLALHGCLEGDERVKLEQKYGNM